MCNCTFCVMNREEDEWWDGPVEPSGYYFGVYNDYLGADYSEPGTEHVYIVIQPKEWVDNHPNDHYLDYTFNIKMPDFIDERESWECNYRVKDEKLTKMQVFFKMIDAGFQYSPEFLDTSTIDIDIEDDYKGPIPHVLRSSDIDRILNNRKRKIGEVQGPINHHIPEPK